MATTTKKSAKKKSAPARAAKKTTKKTGGKTGKRPQKLFTEEELDLVDSTLRPDVGATLTDKVISVLEDAVGTPPVVP